MRVEKDGKVGNMRFNRVFVIVLDSLGIGAMADAAKFDDAGADTRGHISDTVEH